VHHADVPRPRGIDGPAREEQLARVRRPDDLDHLLPEREGHHEPDARQGHAEVRDVGGHAQIAVQGQLAAAGDGIAMHHGNGRMARALDALEGLDPPALRVARLAALRLHLAQIHPGAEGRPRPANHDHAHLA